MVYFYFIVYKPYQVLSSVYIKEIFWDQKNLAQSTAFLANNSFSLDMGYTETLTMKVKVANSQTLQYSLFKY